MYRERNSDSLRVEQYGQNKQVERIEMLGAPDIVWDIEQTCTRIWVKNSP